MKAFKSILKVLLWVVIAAIVGYFIYTGNRI